MIETVTHRRSTGNVALEPEEPENTYPTPARARNPTIRRLYVGLVQAFPAPQQEIDLDQGKEKRAGRDWGKLQTGERGRTKLVHD
jgi:hypothetical protein